MTAVPQLSPEARHGRLADEYDAAQERGEVKGKPGPITSSPELIATVSDIGLTHKEIHEARIIRENISPVAVSDPKIRKTLQLAGLRFMCSRARWLDSEALRLGVALSRGDLTSDQVDAELEAMGGLDLVYPELMAEAFEAAP